MSKKTRNANKPNQAQIDALAQLKAAFAACEAAGLKVLATSDSSTAVEAGVSDFDTVDGEPVVVLWLGDDRCFELDCCDDEADLVADVEAIAEKWLRTLGGDKDNAWPNVLAELEQDYEATGEYGVAVELARNFFQAA